MTIYVMQARSADEASLVRARAVRDGFSWGALVFAQLWLLAFRLWLALAIWVVLEIAFLVLVYPHVSGLTAALVDGLAHLFIGFEGNRLRIAKRARRARVTAVVAANSRDEAEVRFFDEAMAGTLR